MPKPLTIVLTGPESSGKSFLARLLANRYDTIWVKEYLRTFFDEKRMVIEQNMSLVAEKQQEMIINGQKIDKSVILCDTDIITLKVYHQLYFKKEADWFNEMYDSQLVDHYLLMAPDIPWNDDGQRDKPKEREEIFALFKAELDALQCSYTIIDGDFVERTTKAIEIVNSLLMTND